MIHNDPTEFVQYLIVIDKWIVTYGQLVPLVFEVTSSRRNLQDY